MMITHRDYVADGYRRQEMMVRADQHRLIKSLRNEGAQESRYWYRSLGRVGELLVVLGQRMQTRYPMPSRTANIEISHNDGGMNKVAERLATATAALTLSNQPGRTLVTARSSHFAINSVSSPNGPNGERSPLDLLLGALC